LLETVLMPLVILSSASLFVAAIGDAPLWAEAGTAQSAAISVRMIVFMV
jgi:hypothetical protein